MNSSINASKIIINNESNKIISKAEAEEAKKALEEAGATVELK